MLGVITIGPINDLSHDREKLLTAVSALQCSDDEVRLIEDPAALVQVSPRLPSRLGIF